MFLLRLLLYTKTSESWFPLSLISRVLRLNPSQSSNAMIAAMIDAIADVVSSGEAFALFFCSRRNKKCTTEIHCSLFSIISMAVLVNVKFKILLRYGFMLQNYCIFNKSNNNEIYRQCF
jgi:hypothetical protein